ncbi:MAG: radical SAM protein [Pseudomonadota bacterium]
MLKTVSGPLLGPAMLAGAASSSGFTTSVLDLNAEFLLSRLPAKSLVSTPFIGDHDKPEAALDVVFHQFSKFLPGGVSRNSFLRAEVRGSLLEATVSSLVESHYGKWIESRIRQFNVPGFVGLSLLHAGQVLWGLAAATIAKRIWPGIHVIAGGSHITALSSKISSNSSYGRLIDGFVSGYAEDTFVDLLRASREGSSWPAQVFTAGSMLSQRAKENLSSLPVYPSFHPIPWPRPTLPVQASRGCSYGKCSFCTYSAIEGAYREIPTPVIEHSINLAKRTGSSLSFKDSYLTMRRLRLVASLIGGDVEWSAVTKIPVHSDSADLSLLFESGCRTLEVGLETLDPVGQKIIRKETSIDSLESFVEHARNSGIHLVVNVMTGLPGVEESADLYYIEKVKQILSQYGTQYKIEGHDFEVSILSAMACEQRYVRLLSNWPWSAVARHKNLPVPPLLPAL